MSILRIMGNTSDDKEKSYIERCLKVLNTQIYKIGNMNDGTIDCYVDMYHQDIDWLSRSINNIYKTYDFIKDYSLPRYQVDPEFMLNKDFYNNELHDSIVAEYDDICIISKYCENANGDMKNFIYEDSEKLYSYNYHELIEDILMILKCIQDTEFINKILIIGRDNNLYSSILNSYNKFIIDRCDINEYGRYINDQYDCVLIIPYMESQIRNIFSIHSKSFILSGIYNNFRNIKFYYDQLTPIIEVYDNRYKTISSRYWNSIVFGNVNISRYGAYENKE